MMNYNDVIARIKAIALERGSFWAEQGIQGGFELALCAEIAAVLNRESDDLHFWRTGYTVKDAKGSKQVDIVLLENVMGVWQPVIGVEMKVHHLTYGVSKTALKSGKYEACGLIESMNRDAQKTVGVVPVLYVGLLIETTPMSSSIAESILNSGVPTGYLQSPADVAAYIQAQCSKSRYIHHSTIDLGISRGWAVRWHVVIPPQSTKSARRSR